jgi:hypothetical protein
MPLPANPNLQTQVGRGLEGKMMEQTYNVVYDDRTKNAAFYNRARVHKLAQYNAEVSRGIMHTDTWKEFMRIEQEWFNNKEANDG